MPRLSEIAKNTSLVLVNSHPILNRPRPQVPAVIDVGGMHVKKEKKLPDVSMVLNNLLLYLLERLLLQFWTCYSPMLIYHPCKLLF